MRALRIVFTTADGVRHRTAPRCVPQNVADRWRRLILSDPNVVEALVEPVYLFPVAHPVAAAA